MSLCEKYNTVSHSIYDIMYKINSKDMKKTMLKSVDMQLEKLDMQFSKEESFMKHFRIFDTHLTAVAACQNATHVMRDQLIKQINEMES